MCSHCEGWWPTPPTKRVVTLVCAGAPTRARRHTWWMGTPAHGAPPRVLADPRAPTRPSRYHIAVTCIVNSFPGTKRVCSRRTRLFICIVHLFLGTKRVCCRREPRRVGHSRVFGWIRVRLRVLQGIYIYVVYILFLVQTECAQHTRVRLQVLHVSYTARVCIVSSFPGTDRVCSSRTRLVTCSVHSFLGTTRVFSPRS